MNLILTKPCFFKTFTLMRIYDLQCLQLWLFTRCNFIRSEKWKRDMKTSALEITGLYSKHFEHETKSLRSRLMRYLADFFAWLASLISDFKKITLWILLHSELCWSWYPTLLLATYYWHVGHSLIKNIPAYDNFIASLTRLHRYNLHCNTQAFQFKKYSNTSVTLFLISMSLGFITPLMCHYHIQCKTYTSTNTNLLKESVHACVYFCIIHKQSAWNMLGLETEEKGIGETPRWVMSNCGSKCRFEQTVSQLSFMQISSYITPIGPKSHSTRMMLWWCISVMVRCFIPRIHITWNKNKNIHSNNKVCNVLKSDLIVLKIPWMSI